MLFVQLRLTAYGQEDGLWVKPPSKEMLKHTPGLTHHTFESRAMKTQVGFCVVLPPGYVESNEKYPVVYWLHGGGGNESSSLFTAQSWNELYNTLQVSCLI